MPQATAAAGTVSRWKAWSREGWVARGRRLGHRVAVRCKLASSAGSAPTLCTANHWLAAPPTHRDARAQVGQRGDVNGPRHRPCRAPGRRGGRRLGDGRGDRGRRGRRRQQDRLEARQRDIQAEEGLEKLVVGGLCSGMVPGSGQGRLLEFPSGGQQPAAVHGEQHVVQTGPETWPHALGLPTGHAGNAHPTCQRPRANMAPSQQPASASLHP